MIFFARCCRVLKKLSVDSFARYPKQEMLVRARWRRIEMGFG